MAGFGTPLSTRLDKFDFFLAFAPARRTGCLTRLADRSRLAHTPHPVALSSLCGTPCAAAARHRGARRSAFVRPQTGLRHDLARSLSVLPRYAGGVCPQRLACCQPARQLAGTGQTRQPPTRRRAVCQSIGAAYTVAIHPFGTTPPFISTRLRPALTTPGLLMGAALAVHPARAQHSGH